MSEIEKTFKVKVGHRDITISRFNKYEAEAHEARGIYYCDHPYIQIDMKTLAPFDQAEKLIHELNHAVWQQMCLKDKVIEEDAVNALAKGWSALFRDNPFLFQMLNDSLNNNKDLPI